jgi:hypothetical protein
MAEEVRAIPFPAKTWFGSNDNETVTERRGALQAWMNAVLKVCPRHKDVSMFLAEDGTVLPQELGLPASFVSPPRAAVVATGAERTGEESPSCVSVSAGSSTLRAENNRNNFAPVTSGQQQQQQLKQQQQQLRQLLELVEADVVQAQRAGQGDMAAARMLANDLTVPFKAVLEAFVN